MSGEKPDVAILNSMWPTQGVSKADSIHPCTILDVRRATLHPNGQVPTSSDSFPYPEPRNSVHIDLLLPDCAQQQDGSACGLYVGANMFLIAAGIMDPFAPPSAPNAPQAFRYDDHALYSWYAFNFVVNSMFTYVG